MLPEEALDQFKSENYYRMILYLDSNDETERTHEVSNLIVNLTKEKLDKKDMSWVFQLPPQRLKIVLQKMVY